MKEQKQKLFEEYIRELEKGKVYGRKLPTYKMFNSSIKYQGWIKVFGDRKQGFVYAINCKTHYDFMRVDYENNKPSYYRFLKERE